MEDGERLVNCVCREKEVSQGAVSWDAKPYLGTVSKWGTKISLIEVGEKSEEKAEKKMREEGHKMMDSNILKGEKGGG